MVHTALRVGSVPVHREERAEERGGGGDLSPGTACQTMLATSSTAYTPRFPRACITSYYIL
jgi:hypothetical protein